jgi:dihydropteroate synthase
VIEGLRRRAAGPLSIDTSKAAVARAALDAGADVVNDVSGFRFDAAMAPLVAARGVPAVVMHLRGDFASMHRDPRYADVVSEGGRGAARHARVRGAGRRPSRTADRGSGIGFSKDAGHSLAC